MTVIHLAHHDQLARHAHLAHHDQPAHPSRPSPDGTGHPTDPGRLPSPVGTAPIGFVPSVSLTKDEVFGACQALADAERVVRRSGADDEAEALWSLFELLERRVTVAVGDHGGPVEPGVRAGTRPICV